MRPVESRRTIGDGPSRNVDTHVIAYHTGAVFYFLGYTRALTYNQHVGLLALQTSFVALVIRWPNLCINVLLINRQMNQRNADTRSFIHSD